MTVDVCPKCGAELRWVRRGDREVGCCRCNPAGPVIDRPAPEMIAPAPPPEHAPTGAELERLPGVNTEILGALVHAGYTTIEQVRAASDAELLAISGIGPVRLAKIRGIIHNGHSSLG